MRKSIYFLVFIACTCSLTAQETEKATGIRFSGFVKSDFFFDSRQVVAAREGHFLLWPAAVVEDENGDDINAVSGFNFLAVQSRLTGTISGPDAFGAKTSGLIEGDFFAQANDNINLLRLRHAYLKLNWEKTEILMGQFWNPLFVTDCFPGTVSFNTGTPLQSFARNPQFRLSFQSGGLRLMAAALAQRDYASYGPEGTSSSYLRNSSMPDFHLQAQYRMDFGEGGSSFILGTGAAYKTIVPRLKSEMGPPLLRVSYRVNEKVSGLTAIAYARLNTGPLTLKLQGRYGENISDLLSTSGFAVKEITDPITGEAEYTPLKNLTFWGEMHTNGELQAGIFGGFTRNMGTLEPMSDADNMVYGLAQNIHLLYRISPRLMYTAGKTRLACELEYTHAEYGQDYDVNYVPASTKPVSNLRILLSAYYFF